MRADPNTLTAGPDRRQRVEPLDELRQDPQRPPRVRIEELGACRALQERLVLGPARALATGPGASGADDEAATAVPARRRLARRRLRRSSPARMPPRDVAEVSMRGRIDHGGACSWSSGWSGSVRASACSAGRASWSTTCAGRSPALVGVVARRRARGQRVAVAPAAGLSQAVQVASALPGRDLVAVADERQADQARVGRVSRSTISASPIDR